MTNQIARKALRHAIRLRRELDQTIKLINKDNGDETMIAAARGSMTDLNILAKRLAVIVPNGELMFNEHERETLFGFRFTAMPDRLTDHHVIDVKSRAAGDRDED